MWIAFSQPWKQIEISDINVASCSDYLSLIRFKISTHHYKCIHVTKGVGMKNECSSILFKILIEKQKKLQVFCVLLHCVTCTNGLTGDINRLVASVNKPVNFWGNFPIEKILAIVNLGRFCLTWSLFKALSHWEQPICLNSSSWWQQ